MRCACRRLRGSPNTTLIERCLVEPQSMPSAQSGNPLLAPIIDSFGIKRAKKTSIVPPNSLLAMLLILDRIHDSDAPLYEDDLYTYDYTLKDSRGAAIKALLRKHGFPDRK